jgi:hypothetical protein
MLASAAWFIFTPVLLAYIGVRAGALIALLFLLLAGFSGGIAGITANRTAIHLSLGAMFVGTTAAVLGMYRFIKPIVDDYTAGFILAGIGAPILIMLAVFFTGVLTLGLTYMLPFLGTYFVSYAVEAVLEDNFMMGASPMGVAALTGMAACYVILGWVSFAGGWQALANL